MVHSYEFIVQLIFHFLVFKKYKQNYDGLDVSGKTFFCFLFYWLSNNNTRKFSFDMNQVLPHPSPVPNPHIRPSTCAFPAPPVRSVYCEPAAYSQINGQRYQKIVYAYGKSRPMY